MFKRKQFKIDLFIYEINKCRPRQREDKSEKVSMHFLTRCALKQYINNYQIHFRAINAVLMTFEAKTAVDLISKSGCPNLNALKSVSSATGLSAVCDCGIS